MSKFEFLICSVLVKNIKNITPLSSISPIAFI